MHLYTVGTEVATGSILRAVYLDYVTIERGGATFVLRLPRFPELRGPGRLSQPSRLLAANGLIDPVASSAEEHSFDPPPMPASGAIVHSLNLLPALEHGKRIGMRVGTSQEGARIRQLLGFNSGDVVVALNGDSILAQPGTGTGALMRAINSEDTVTLTVERQGQPVTITIDASRAAQAASAFNSAL